MLKKYFIPVMIALLFVVVIVYFVSGSTSRPRDMRVAVPVEHFMLRNGLTVVVMPNERLPIVTHMLVVKAGGADDPQGKTGLAHYLEHLQFTGTANFPEGEYDRAINRVGGAHNASTGRDYTVYYATVPSDQLDLVMTMEADRMMPRTFAPDKAARELKVITEERGLRVENNPAAQWGEQLDAITFLNHPYGQPLIGWAEDIASFTAADAQAFFERHYRPSNMVLVVAGDVEPREVRRMAQRYYGGMIAGDTPPRNWPKEPPIRLKRHAVMEDPRVGEPRLTIRFVAPSIVSGTQAQAMPLMVLAEYLGGGDASALYTALVREQKLATNIWTEYDAQMLGPAQFRIGAIPAAGVTLEELEKAIHRELARLLSSAPDAEALARAKTQLTASATFAQDSTVGLASMMAELYAIGLDERYFYDWSASVQKVSGEEVLSAARTVLVSAKSVTGYLLPEEKKAEMSGVATPPAAATAKSSFEVPYGP